MEPSLQFSQPIHPLAIEVCQVLRNASYQAYIVGGCVRDLHLGLIPKDWDICTDASPEEVIGLFPKTIPTGLQHGTITVVMGEGTTNHFEVTTFRTEGDYLDGRHPETVQFVKSITEDLARRDFTINAMAYDPIGKVEVDPFDGLTDLQNEIIRAVGDANARFQEDGLRIMRAARFAARFGYQVEATTLQGMKDNLSTLQKVSKERISDELRKLISSSHPWYGMDLLKMTGILAIICPIMYSNITEPDPEHQLIFLTHFSSDTTLETRLALLYHDCWNKLAETELNDLRFSGKEMKRVSFLLDTLTQFRILLTNKTSLGYAKLVARFKNEAPDAWKDTWGQFVELAKGLQLPIREMMLDYRNVIVHPRKELAINGNDLLDAGVKPGPTLKVLLDSAYQEILRYPEHNDKDFLLQFLSTPER